MLTDQELQSLRNLGNESEAAADEIVRLRGALRNVLMLRRLGGMLPGTNEVVQCVVDAAEAALQAR